MNRNRYNKKRKPWRKLKWTDNYKKYKKQRVMIALCILVIIEGAILLPHDWNKIFAVSHNAQVKEEPVNKSDATQEPGETREQGLSIDWKEGTLKLWQKVERVELKKD